MSVRGESLDATTGRLRVALPALAMLLILCVLALAWQRVSPAQGQTSQIPGGQQTPQGSPPAANDPSVDPRQAGNDVFPSVGVINLTLNIPGQPEKTETIEVSSQTGQNAVVQRGALSGTTIPTEIISMNLVGTSPTLGPVEVFVGQRYGLRPTIGEVQNVALDPGGSLVFGDSFFDVFFELFAPKSEVGPVFARNDNPLKMSAEIFDLPPNRPRPTPAEALAVDHYLCYSVRQRRATRSRAVELKDQFETQKTKVAKARLLCNPVTKNKTRMKNSREHLVCYAIADRKGIKSEALGIRNQFGAETVTLGDRQFLCLPSRKKVLKGTTRPVPRGSRPVLGHYKCYGVARRKARPPGRVGLSDQFASLTAQVDAPLRLCNPVEKTHRGKKFPVRNPKAHLTCYGLTPTKVKRRVVEVRNQFGKQQLTVLRRESLCLPTHKTRCSEYAEQSQVALMSQAGSQVGKVNSAIHIPFRDNPEAGCP